MKIKLSKSQWEDAGKKAGWVKTAKLVSFNINERIIIAQDNTQELINIFNKRYGEDISKWKWSHISYYQNLSEDFIRKFQDKADWRSISINQKLSEDFIREFQDKVDWFWASRYQKLSEDFIREFQNKVNWKSISEYQKLSEDFINEFKNKIRWDYLLQNKYCPHDIKFKYIKDNNMLTKEDPSKHSIEEIEEEKKDTSLDTLKELVAFNINEKAITKGNNMKIKLSKSQWENVGRNAGWMKISQIEGETVDSNLKSVSNPLSGMTKVRAIRFIGKLMDKYTRGLFSDEYWNPINKIFQELSHNNVSYVVKSAEYRENEKGTPIAKTWKFEIEFLNEKNKPSILYGNITASGAGTVEDPLAKYDIIAYVS